MANLVLEKRGLRVHSNTEFGPIIMNFPSQERNSCHISLHHTFAIIAEF
jgi:hypothetical protein